MLIDIARSFLMVDQAVPIADPSPNRHTPIAADPVVWPGYDYAWLCTSATVEGLARGRACWAAGQIGESAHPGQRVSAEDR